MADRRRVFRIAEQIRGLLATELHRLADPRFSLLTVTSVVVSPDLRNAKIYWVSTGADEARKAEVAQALISANGIFRKLLAEELGIKFVPQLRFYYDDTLDARDEVERLLSRIRTEPAPPNEESPAEDEEKYIEKK
jgi:ribosome-binding factor A